MNQSYPCQQCNMDEGSPVCLRDQRCPNQKPMTREELDTRLASLTDTELAVCLKTAAADLEKAAEDDRDSEWHSACFAATIVYCQETDRRKRVNSRLPNQ